MTRFEFILNRTTPDHISSFIPSIAMLLDNERHDTTGMNRVEMVAAAKLIKCGLMAYKAGWCWLTEEGREARRKFLLSARSIMESNSSEQED